MGLFDVLLGVDRAARDTKIRMKIRVLAEDPLSAAIQAESLGDRRVEDPLTMYCHAMRATPVIQPVPAAMALAA